MLHNVVIREKKWKVVIVKADQSKSNQPNQAVESISQERTCVIKTFYFPPFPFPLLLLMRTHQWQAANHKEKTEKRVWNKKSCSYGGWWAKRVHMHHHLFIFSYLIILLYFSWAQQQNWLLPMLCCCSGINYNTTSLQSTLLS